MRLLWLVGWAGCARTADPADAPSGDTDAPTDTDTLELPGDTDAPPAAVPRVRWFLHGGGSEDDAVFQHLVDAAGGGRMVTLGAVEDPADPDLDWWDGYFVSLGASEAVTVNTATLADADDPSAAALVASADGIFLRGGDQSRYVQWAGTALGDALEAAWAAGAVIGGSSAGCAVLGERIYDARVSSVEPWELLVDGADPGATFSPGFGFGVPDVITDTHFTERGRLPRLAVFAARWAAEGGRDEVLGVGVDPNTALVLRDDGTGFVVGAGAVTLLQVRADDVSIVDGAPPDVADAPLWQLPEGYEVDLRADDPVRARPAWVEPRAPGGAGAAWDEVVLAGDRAGTSAAGSWRLSGFDDPWAYVDRTLTLTAGEGALPGLLVHARLYADGDLDEATLGGLMWALATQPGLVVVGLDEGGTATASPPRRLGEVDEVAALVLDARSASWAGDPGSGWQTAAIEGATLHLLGEGRDLDL